ncbi:efflux RND transporter periplasmic adaptor subunit [Thalassotalea sp. Y01]|uniref:efflux RND transporter periplasmic adaptor subunit n=1 Tax=Thalassotalea sp. Y01 TaxID=2729613 RepID=UPI00145E9D62|nr:efflux RND transporter periplasmic adaptor subunit [Thalassotalea sp. Y01]NMP15006.1 efflux RND transporter periplasmic adaptor subunit [Thalassotalea sp. Y01]
MKKIVLPLMILIGFIAIAVMVLSNPPGSQRSGKPQVAQLKVEARQLQAQDYAISVSSYGVVKPRTQSMLFPQVSGQIVAIDDSFRDGGFFEKGDVLVRIDDRDYRAEMKIAESNLLSAEQALSEEKARVQQAEQDWTRLGNSDQAPDLVLRKPQLMAAEAQVYAAKASLDKARLALERTRIIAPYTGRILKKQVDIGQVVSSGSQLAEMYAVDYVEIRLPIKNSDLQYMVLPESSRLQSASLKDQPLVHFTSDLVAQSQWQGKVVRTEGAFDSQSQQLFVVAQIDDPYGRRMDDSLPIKIGQYVSASIAGKTIKEALVIPNRAIYQGSYVYLVEQGKLKRQTVSIAWQNDQQAVIASGLRAGQMLVTTPLGQVNSGTLVSILNKQPDTQQPLESIAKGNGDAMQKTAKDKKGNVIDGLQDDFGT